MRKKLNLVVFILFSYSVVFATGGPGSGYGPRDPKTPIDTNEIILIAVAVLLIVGAIAYRKLSIKKA